MGHIVVQSQAFPSALQLDLAESYRELCQTYKDDPSLLLVEDYLASPHQGRVQDLLDRLAQTSLAGDLILPVSAQLRPLLLDFSYRLLEYHRRAGDSRVTGLVLHCYAILIGLYPEVYDAVATFARDVRFGELCRLASFESIETLNQLLLDLYRLASASPFLLQKSDDTIFDSDWLTLFVLPTSLPLATRLLAQNLFALSKGLSETAKVDLQQKTARRTTDLQSQDATAELCYDTFPLNVWILEAAEFKRIQSAQDIVASTEVCYIADELAAQREDAMDLDSSSTSSFKLSVHDLSSHVCCIGGVLLPRTDTAGTSVALSSTSEFVETPCISPALSEIALHLSSGLPILLSGPSASGKSSLISHVAQLIKGQETSSTGSHLLTIQLGDQSGVDAKQLLGSFVSSPSQPGKFEWTEGALTRAVRLGKWLVLEDIDKAGSEVLSTIARLVEQLGPTKPLGYRPFIDLGNRGKVFAGDGFALFATRSIQSTQTSALPSRPTFLGSSHWSEILLKQPDQGDVEAILQSKFPSFSQRRASFVDRLVQTWYKLQRATLSSAAKSSASQAQRNLAPAGSVRGATLRDLIKWFTRVERLMAGEFQLSDPLSNPLLQEEIFIEACDVFLGSVPPPPKPSAGSSGKSADRYSALVELMAEELGLSSERAWWTLRERKPELSVRTNESTNGLQAQEATSRIKIGRCELPRRSRAAAKRSAPMNRQFAMTKPSLFLLEQLAVASILAEPVLLVGETGTGKTTVIQHLASLLGQPITALNLSQQTESGDLLGAFKPLDPKVPATELHDVWSSLFARTFSARRNARFVDAERKAFVSGKWARVAGLWRESVKMALARKKTVADEAILRPDLSKTDLASRKKRRTDDGVAPGSPAELDDTHAETSLDKEWQEFDQKARDFAIQHAGKKKNLVFSFVEGPLVKALRNGDWILLDEINLAAAETLDGLTGLLQSSTSSVTLTERGDLEPVPRHPNFRLFACMNPATDVGKKDLPPNLRSRFTELYVPSPDSDREALTSIVDKYIGEHALGDRGAVLDVAECYAEIRRLANNHELADGANQRPHFSIRTLARALTFATDIAPQYGLRRSLWEGFIMAFTLLLDENSARPVRTIIESQILAKAKNARAIATFVPPAPKEAADGKFVQVGPFWLPTGPLALDTAEDYILTPSVQGKLVGLSRAALTRRFPVLVQGPTSAGKTSAVEYLARRTGHRFVRINNHEHTDIQEYIGSYASDPDTGKLSFQEGLLVKALRRGDWIVLDELNLAPTDVLEALNRLLDDNRELVIPETGEVVKPHPHFMLFATQNPPGLYAGRKVLSRAFRNRFLELHFDDVPRAELETILTNRCKIAPSYASRIVGVFEELQKRRQTGRVFDTKQAFVTLRDLFRWGNRDAMGYQQLAENGYMLIAERARREEDKETVKEVIEKIMKVKLNVETLYCLEGPDSQAALARIGAGIGSAVIETLNQSTIVKTSAFQRLVCLVATSLRYNEPVLLVGETGAGKTSVCEVLVAAFGRKLHCVNCHQNTDTSDLLGGQRPLRNRAVLQQTAKASALEALAALDISVELDNDCKIEDVSRFIEGTLSKWPISESGSEDQIASKDKLQSALRAIYQSTALFEWQDGPLVQALRSGDHVLLDEISLADDSVLERLNSVLEPARTLVLAERATSSNQQASGISNAQIVAEEGFQVLATMNPGGDYGKKELSPALRNRFTEIWVPHVDIHADLVQIINSQWKDSNLTQWTEKMLDFSDWFIHQVGGRDQSGLGLRDLLTWASFMNTVSAGDTPVLASALGFAHGASLTIIDGLGALPATAAMSIHGLAELKARCLSKLSSLIQPTEYDQSSPSLQNVNISFEHLSVGPFSIAQGAIPFSTSRDEFSFTAKTSASNAMRVMRALCVPNKSVLLEGSPGAGKTSLVTALARAAHRPLTRINLSDQTELVDLFGSDMPLEGGGPGEFAWRDAAFLTAMQTGEWVLLDEMNLASQTVLEGLNSCLDHRGTVYVPELGRSFQKHPDFRIFAAQNPHHQGGGRKGLPKSFLNRFVKVHIEELTADDILAISQHLYPSFDQKKLSSMIRFNFDLHHETVVRRSFGRIGAPWEFNLRDLLRWLDLLHTNLGLNTLGDPVEHLASLYVQRFRTAADRKAARELYRRAFDSEPMSDPRIVPTVTSRSIRIGHAVMKRRQAHSPDQGKGVLLQGQFAPLETLMDCVHKQWLAILVGPTGAGKTSLVRLLAQLAGARLEEISMSSGTDTMDLIGTFEQFDPDTKLRAKLSDLLQQLDSRLGYVTCKLSKHLSDFISAKQEMAGHLDILNRSDHSAFEADQFETALARIQAVADELPTSAVATAVQEVRAAFQEKTHTSDEAKPASGRFEWIEGPLLHALREGHWLLLDNANLCSASVLDRLNSLFETNGSLVVSERGVIDGEVPIIRPHPNFRVFMCLDPRHGELSRAMRNRGIEIAVFDQSDTPANDAQRLQLLCGSRNSHSVLDPHVQQPANNSMQGRLMFETVQSQKMRRGVLNFDTETAIFSSADSSRVLSWAASQLALRNSTLASALVSLSMTKLVDVDDVTKGSLLARISTSEAALLLQQLMTSYPSAMPETAVAVLRGSQQMNMPGSIASGTTPLVRSQQLSKPLAKMLLTDIRYDPQILQLLAASDDFVQPSSILDLFLRTLLSVMEFRKVVGSSRNKKPQDLTVFERSALSIDQGGDQDEDEATTAVRHVFSLSINLSSSVLGWLSTLSNDASASDIRQLGMLLRHAEFLGILCSTSELDFSSVQVLARSMSDLVQDIEMSLDQSNSHLTDGLAELGGTIRLTTGHAFQHIWNMFGADQGMQANISRILCDEITAFPTASPDVLRNALDLAATLRIANTQSCSPGEAQELLQLGLQALKIVRSEANKGSMESDAAQQSQESITEALLLNVVEVSLKSPEAIRGSDSDRLKVFLRLLEQHNSAAVQTASVAAKIALWTTRTPSDQARLLLTDFTWIQRLWVCQTSGGPAELLRPLLLHTLLESRSGTRTLLEKAQHDLSVKRLVQSAGASMPASSPSRLDRLRVVLIDFTRSMSAWLLTSLQEDTDRQVADLPSALPDIRAHFDEALRQQPASDKSAGMVAEWTAFLSEAVFLIGSGTNDHMALGRCWVSLSLTMLRLYLPSVAVDPIVSRQTMSSFNEYCREQTRASISLEMACEEAVTGHRHNPVISELRAELEILERQTAGQKGTQTGAWRKANLKLLSQLYREVHSFCKEVISPAKMENLSRTIRTGLNDQTIQREESLQASILSFAIRLRKTFSPLRDIVEPVYASLLQLQLGFRIMVQTARTASADTEVGQKSDIVETLVSFPTALSSQRFRDLKLPSQLRPRSSDHAAPLLVISAASLAFDRTHLGDSIRQSPTALQYLSRTYEQIFQLWSLDRERLKLDEEEASSLFKSRKIEESIEMDADAEEKEFRSLFPEYDDDILDGPLQRLDQDEPAAQARNKTLLPATLFVPVLHVHNSTFGHKSTAQGRDAYESHRVELVSKLVRKHYVNFSEDLDKAGAAFGLLLAARHSDATSASASSSHFNFYLDPRPGETSKATVIVQELRERLSALITDWPEQMVLQHIRDRCDAVLRLDANSPVARILSALEQLLTHTEDWEGFASSATSIKANRDRISSQLIEWRRLELSCWAELLNSQAQTFEDGVAEWWFRIYEILIRGTRAAASEGSTALEKHIENLIDAVDQFIRSSPLGQFEARLGLLESYATFMDLLVQFAPPRDSTGFAETRLVLQNVTSFFRQFSDRISATLQSQRAVLEKDITSFIKLASWKDVNIHALKQSAAKTHRQLHKTIRKFRDVLRQPVDPILAAHLDALSRKDMPVITQEDVPRTTATVHASTWAKVTKEVDTSAPEHIRNLSKTLDVLARMTTDKLLPALLSPITGLALSDFADEIVDRQQQLAKLTPAFAKEDNEKAIKSLIARKRKAWSDLLKELRRIGLSSFLKTDVANANQSLMHVYTQPLLLSACPSSLECGPFSDLEQFYFRILASLPKVRGSLEGHNPDLSTSELQRGLNYIEHVTSLVLQERGRMFSQLKTLATLEEVASRLQILHSADVRSLVPATSRTPFLSLVDFLARLEAALAEVHTKAPELLRVSAFTQVGGEAFLSRMMSAHTALANHRRILQAVSENVIPGSTLYFLTDKEVEAMDAAEHHVREVDICLASGQKEFWALEALLQPTRTWLAKGQLLFDECREALEGLLPMDYDATDLPTEADHLISSVLQIAQDVKSSQMPKSEADDLPDKAISLDLHRLEKQQAYLRSDSMLSSVVRFLDSAQRLSDGQEDVARLQLARVYPFVHEYCELLRGHIVSSANFSKCLLKLDHVLCNLMVALASKGFCKPPEEQKDEDGQGDGEDQLEGGTGLADGSGAKDITDQMDDEDEIEELQKDDPLDQGDDGEEKTEREKNAKEADQDFGGDMEDISVDGDEEEGEDPDSDDEQPEEAVGDVDPLDPNAVDEKMWDGNDDKDDDRADANDKTDNDLGGEDADQPQSEAPQKPEGANAADDKNQSKEQAGERAEDQADDGEQDQQDQSATEDGERQTEDQQGEDGDDQPDNGEDEDEEAEAGAEGGGRQMDQEADQGENLDLNDDIDMTGDSQKDDSDSDEDMGDLSDLDQPPEDQDIDHRPDTKDFDDMVDDAKDDAEKADEQDTAAEERTDEDATVPKEDGEDAMAEDDDGKEEGDVPQISDQDPQPAGGSTEDQSDPFDLDAVDQGAEDGGQDKSANQQQSSRSRQGRRVEAQNQNMDADEGREDQEDGSEAVDQPHPSDSAGAKGSKAEEAQNQDPTSESEPRADQGDEMNPVRSMGTALEEFRRRLEEIQAAREDEEDVLGDDAKPDGEGMPEEGEVEHVANDDNAELQALGAAKEQDELQKLGDLALEDQDESMGDKPRADETREMDDSEQRGPQPLPEQPEQQPEVKRDGQQKAFMPSDLKPPAITAEREALLKEGGDANEADNDMDVEEDMTPLPDETRESADHAIQGQLELFRTVESSEERLTQAGDLWRSYASLTADLAFSLCEQLRLVLAPTLATRLNGDFRTGKRLNMRKIVPFIASDFAKDKIWLRRTKPSSREYQVMLAIDDSRSMSESRSAHLAYQTLALVTGALSRLEVGDVSICRFGEEVESLHDFGKGTFNDQNGAHVIDKLGFQQKGTNVLKLVEKSLDSLAEARASRSSSSASQAADLWQLEIIISDGICQDHAKLRSLLRRAAEQRVMLVFVVIDSLQQQPSAAGTKQQQLEQQRSSILDMNNVSYYTDANGKLQLKMERYMDTFPFEYYVVVREVDALPEVLSATLRQWVEKIRETET